jgi:short-subunit dehydrogenase involved in D-alanine esterification of teichoic acids
MEAILKDFPRVDILINNAGIFIDSGVKTLEAKPETVLRNLA